MKCTRCDKERQTLPVYCTKPGGYSMFMPSSFDFDPELPTTEHVCGSCFTDDEIIRSAGPVVEFIVGAMIRNIKAGNATSKGELLAALDWVRAFFQTRHNEGDSRGRDMALKAMGLNGN